MGLDLSCSPARPSAALLLSDNLSQAAPFLPATDEQIVFLAQSQRPSLIAIDAPLYLPAGWCCLEETCPCGQADISALRQAERELDRHGLQCFHTTKKSIIKGMVYRGIALRKELCRRGYEVIEVYPYGSKVRLWGKPFPRKTTTKGLNFLRERLRELLPSPRPQLSVWDHNLCDAAVAAYTAYLYGRGETEAVGAAEDGKIVLPRPKPRPLWLEGSSCSP